MSKQIVNKATYKKVAKMLALARKWGKEDNKRFRNEYGMHILNSPAKFRYLNTEGWRVRQIREKAYALLGADVVREWKDIKDKTHHNEKHTYTYECKIRNGLLKKPKTTVLIHATSTPKSDLGKLRNDFFDVFEMCGAKNLRGCRDYIARGEVKKYYSMWKLFFRVEVFKETIPELKNKLETIANIKELDITHC